MAGPDLELLRRVSADRALASVTLFPHRHAQAESGMHVELMDVFASADPLVQVEAFREAGKTTKLEEHLILGGCFRNFNYCLFIGETYDKAIQRLASIDYELVSNERLHRLFGGPVLARKSIENKIFFKSGAFIQALGWEQELQSFKYLHHRPDVAVLDDVENRERVRDAAAVGQSIYKLFQELMPAMDAQRSKIINSQTRLAEDCMVVRLAASPEWLYRGWPICDRDPDDPECVATWPERYPMSWIREKKRVYQQSGMLGAFLQTYMLQAVNPAGKPFREDMLVELEVSPWKDWMPRFAIYDPSRTTNRQRSMQGSKQVDKSDPAGKVVISRLGSQILVHESAAPYWKPDEFVADLFAVQERHAPVKIAIEKNSLDDWLLQPIRLEILRRGVALPIFPLQAPQDRSKDEFIMGLQPFFEANDVVLIGGRMAHPALCAEVKNFPKGPRGILNALAYALRVIGGVPMYEDFGGANIGDAPAPRMGEEVYVGITATPAEVVAVAVVRDGRRLCVSADWSAAGSLQDAVKTLVFEVRSTYPRASLQVWIPAEIHDQWQRIALVPALRAEKLTAFRGEHVAIARGCLAERIRQTWHGARLLTVDKRARLTLNSLAAGYTLPVEAGGRIAQEPEKGMSRLVAEALECLVAVLDRQEDAADGIPKGANIGIAPSGARYVTANPRARS